MEYDSTYHNHPVSKTTDRDIYSGLRREEHYLAFAKSDLISSPNATEVTAVTIPNATHVTPLTIPNASEVTYLRKKGWAACYMETPRALLSAGFDFHFSFCKQTDECRTEVEDSIFLGPLSLSSPS